MKLTKHREVASFEHKKKDLLRDKSYLNLKKNEKLVNMPATLSMMSEIENGSKNTMFRKRCTETGE